MRRPTARQLLLLEHASTGNMIVGADQRRLAEKGWVEQEPTSGPLGPFVRLTDVGAAVLADERERVEWDALSHAEQVTWVTKRHGSNGWEVRCRTCRQAREAAGSRSPHEPVWYTNEGGEKWRREAQDAARRHGMRHVREARETAAQD